RAALPLLLLLLPGAAHACSTPVFRYALERWRPTPYEVHVIRRAPLSERDQALVERLRQAKTANVSVRLIDGDDAPPRVHVRRAGDDAKAPALWSVPLTASTVDQLLDSPARRQLAHLLGTGESAVWLLLASGDRKADEAALALLRRELARL